MHLSVCRFLIPTVIFLFCLLVIVNVANGSQLAVSVPSPEQTVVSTVSKNIPVQRDSVVKAKEGDLISYVLAFGVVCLGGLAVFAYSSTARTKARKFLSVRLGSMHTGIARDLKLKQQLSLTTKHSVHLVAWNSEEFLLACGDHGVTLISQRDLSKLKSKEENLTVGNPPAKVEDQFS